MIGEGGSEGRSIRTKSQGAIGGAVLGGNRCVAQLTSHRSGQIKVAGVKVEVPRCRSIWSLAGLVFGGDNTYKLPAGTVPSRCFCSIVLRLFWDEQ